MNVKVKEALGRLYEGVHDLNACVAHTDEFVVTEDLRRAIQEVEAQIHKARKVFESQIDTNGRIENGTR